ncbi:hypothetical protein [Leptolyngbya sp. FACHB-8]|uniref:hypothetical protein n=1 Tax=unclassified Leptolyngbya TaxID=2650499 RepID=UPI001687A538|nr:hypothetical protein [Leptolyngbya sp. FACHB-8]MBD1910278.1 hypothetical protein [Leptolyngbya sp. FACHB-8]
MSLAKQDQSVTPPKNSGSTAPIRSRNASYQIRWKKQAQRALQKAKRGGHPDRRERRLIAKFKAWEAAQRQQQQQSTPEQQKAAA